VKLQIITILIVTLITSCQTKKKEILQKTKDTHTFFVGTYTDSISKGIYSYSLDKNGFIHRLGLAAVSDNPSFLTKSTDGKFLLAVNEINNKDSVGIVESYLIQGDSLLLINKSSTGGAHPCFVSVNKAGYVLTANYTGGNIGLLKLNKKGKLSHLLDVQQHFGKDTLEQKDRPHAHFSRFTSENAIISVDLGTNELWLSKLDTVNKKLRPSNPNTLKMDLGDGSRHLTIHPNKKWIYIINEFSNTVTLVNKNQKLEKIASFSTLPNNYSETSYGADIHISSDGKFLYASNRGHNSLAIFEISPENGYLNLIENQSVHGNWPRNFTLSPDENYIVVANQHSNTITSFKRDKVTGLLQFVDEVEAPSPTCILF